MKAREFLPILPLLLLLTACNKPEPIKTQAPPATPAVEEWLNETFDLGDISARQAIRAAAQSYAQSSFPGCTVQGLSTTVFTGNLCYVGIDVSCGTERRTRDLIARRFYPTDNSPAYWKVEPLTPELGQALSGYAVKRLESEVEELRQQLEHEQK